jgi:hypothetical protein
VRRSIRFAPGVPADVGRLPVALAVLLQTVALLAVLTVVRDERPNPTADPAGWEHMGAFVLFTSIAPLAALFTAMVVVGLHAFSATNPVERSRDCALMARSLGIGAAITDTELLWYGAWKGIWEMFGPMAVIAPLDFALTFLVLRYSD